MCVGTLVNMGDDVEVVLDRGGPEASSWASGGELGGVVESWAAPVSGTSYWPTDMVAV